MRNILALAFLLWEATFSVRAQNPASSPKDATLTGPELNFEVFWQTFEDNYAFFKLRNIDWNKAYQQYRSRVNARTSDDALHSIFCAMLTPFQDNHINFNALGWPPFKSIKPSRFLREFSTENLRNVFWDMVDQTLETNGFGGLQSVGPAFNGKPLFRHSVSAKFGYLRFNRCFVDQEAENRADAMVLSNILNTVFTNFAPAKGLIIDVRDNIGGNDEFVYELAGRFAAKKVVGSYKKTRKSGGDYEEWITPETWYLEPKGPSPFLGPVVLLTNDKTVSAGDLYAMIMKVLPQVRIIGENTRGIYSDMYGFKLPNGWRLTLSNQRYYNADMVCYEGTGTPVDIVVKNTREDFVKMIDPVIVRALAELNKATSSIK